MEFIQPQTLFLVFSALLGLVLGSFYNVCIHRYLQGGSILSPRSHCPNCSHFLSWWENIPLLSYLLLRGRCRECKAAISLRYPLVEALSGLWALLLAIKFGPGMPWLVYLLFGGILIVMSFIDFEAFILPDSLTLPGGMAAFLAATFLLGMPWQTSLIGGIAGAGIFLALQQGYKYLKGIEGLGTGDIKLMFLLGALLGWMALPLMILLGAVCGLLASLFYLAKNAKHGLQTAIPFGPFLNLGAMLYILFGPRIWQWYLG
ncbi:MAG: prepilin peptidase [Thermodesulfobacteriota bacterium]